MSTRRYLCPNPACGSPDLQTVPRDTDGAPALLWCLECGVMAVHPDAPPLLPRPPLWRVLWDYLRG